MLTFLGTHEYENYIIGIQFIFKILLNCIITNFQQYFIFLKRKYKKYNRCVPLTIPKVWPETTQTYLNL